MTKLALPIGVDDFKEIVEKEYYYVDKTLFIKELLDLKGKINVFMRPRRFGKSLNLSMLKYFFEKTEEDNSKLFEGLKIWKAGEEYREKQGKYPVIHVSFKSTKTASWDEMKKSFQSVIRSEFLRHEYLMSSESLNSFEKNDFKSVLLSDNNLNIDDYKMSIKNLSVYLEKHYGEKVILLIDEYDVPLQTAYTNGFYSKAVSFVSGLFQESMKDAVSLEFAVVTGCLRISKESIFTGFNNPKMISILNNSYSEHFGFEEHEVEEMLKYYGFSDKFQITKEWYNGYKFGQTGVMNPWSVLMYVTDLLSDPEKLPESYWANTSGNNIVRDLISKLDRENIVSAKNDLEILMRGETVEKRLDVNVTYIDIDKSVENIWNMLFFTGYLTQVSKRRVGREDFYGLKIPNEEVAYIYETMIASWFNEEVLSKNFNVLYRSLLESDVPVLTDEINKVLGRSISYMDSQETFYHGMMLGILSCLPNYKIKSNRETGNGRSDIVLVPLSGDGPVVIMELKVAKKRKERKSKCEEALQQIEDKKYDAEFIDEGYENIIKYGIAFIEKECMVLTVKEEGDKD